MFEPEIVPGYFVWPFCIADTRRNGLAIAEIAALRILDAVDNLRPHQNIAQTRQTFAKYVGFVDFVPSLCCSQLDTESKAITKSTEAIMRGSDDDLFFHPTMIVRKAYVR